MLSNMERDARRQVTAEVVGLYGYWDSDLDNILSHYLILPRRNFPARAFNKPNHTLMVGDEINLMSRLEREDAEQHFEDAAQDLIVALGMLEYFDYLDEQEKLNDYTNAYNFVYGKNILPDDLQLENLSEETRDMLIRVAGLQKELEEATKAAKGD